MVTEELQRIYKRLLLMIIIAPVANVATLSTVTGQCSQRWQRQLLLTDNCVGQVTATTTSPS
jgi:small neutral amino acid transporter SnatA (MarC family)